MTPDNKSDEKVDEAALESTGIQPDVQLQLESPASESAEERRLVRKQDGRILPIACLMYLFACQ
jgi:hypothetical protein